MDWFLEVMPSNEIETSYSPGDLYDILNTSHEVRFHAAHLFLRYFSQVGALPAPSQSDADGEIAEYDDAVKAVIWDIAVACLAVSVKFHRDVLPPLDVIYALDYVDLAPHDMSFDDLENAQRDVLEALKYRVGGSATPGAFMAELWASLPTLRCLLSFDGGRAAVQEAAWVMLCDALQRPEMLQYPISLLTAASLIDGILGVLAKRYKATGRYRPGKALRKRDAESLKKAALEESRGVRLDIQDVLGITDDELLRCEKWLSPSGDRPPS
ncbi:hypothetical protein BV20DRAFT_974708 [Pilatotrama ljubarskyi]|nr:hypothetical protein BV20DRAFT_974708 [Pilatotrama ljubarskyi]